MEGSAMRSYDKWWLNKDMENMGFFFEYCDKYCWDIYRVKIDKVKLLTAFMNSNFRRVMELGHPRLLSQSAKDSLVQWISADYAGNLSDFLIKKSKKWNYAHNQFYWVGWMYAYLHYKSGLSSKTIVTRLPIDLMLEHYYLGHEMSKEAYFARAGRKLDFGKRELEQV